jgi:hypothetical protein
MAAPTLPFVAAVQLSEEGHPQVARFDPVTGFTKEAIGHWAKRYLGASTRLSDGLNCFPGVEQAGAVHVPEVVGRGTNSVRRPSMYASTQTVKWLRCMLQSANR